MEKQFMTIRNAAKALGIGEAFVRREFAAGRVAGFKSGSRAYVDVPAFRDALSRANIKEGAIADDE